MDNNWKLSDIPYVKPDFDAIQHKLDELTERMKSAQNYGDVKKVLEERNALNDELSVADTLIYARAFHDVTDEFYQTELQTTVPKIQMLKTEDLSRAIAESPFADDIDAEYGPHFRELLTLQIRLGETGKEKRARIGELEALYQQKKASMKFDLRGEKVSEGKIFEALTSTDRALRKEAYEASLRAYCAQKDEYEPILRELVETRDALAKENGFENYIGYANLSQLRIGYGDKELSRFVDDVRRYITPLYVRLLEEQRVRLGVDRLMPYDATLVFPDGNAKPVCGDDALENAARIMYHGLSSEAGEFFDKMARHGMLDIASSDKKIAGMGFCEIVPGEWKMPFIFANRNGTADDVMVYTHELGHALQGYLAMHTQTLGDYCCGGPDLCEIHSETMEMLSYPYAHLFFGNDSDRFIRQHHYGIVKKICAYCHRYAFERYLYTHVDATTEEWAAEYDRIGKTFGRSLNNEQWMDSILQGGALFEDMAVNTSPLYVVSYALSQICALELKAAYDNDPVDGWQRYHKLCCLGGSKSYRDTLAEAGLELPFADGAVEQAAQMLARQ